jgi:poly-beta-1,6-N-acetyl-D-glucosamine N-deacetylase
MRGFLLSLLLPLTLFADAHIFVFHRFGDARHPSTDTSIQTLRSEFEYLKRNGYKVIPLSTLAEALREKKPIDDKWVVLTIDDSFKSFYKNGLPVFKAYRYPFTLFVYVKSADKRYPDYMTWAQIRETQKYGEIALHSYAHPHETRLSADQLKADTTKALQRFEEELHFTPRYYAYPYGEYDANVKKIIAGYGFDLILNQNSGAVNSDSNPMDLDRTALTGQDLIAEKLRIEYLSAEWFAPKQWPAGGRLKEIHAKISSEYKSAQLYVSGFGWHRVHVKDGIVSEKTDLDLTKTRTRLFIKVGRKQSGIILVKE